MKRLCIKDGKSPYWLDLVYIGKGKLVDIIIDVNVIGEYGSKCSRLYSGNLGKSI